MLPESNVQVAITPISKTNGATADTTAGLAIDTKGYDYMQLVVFTGTADVVSDTLSVLKLQECDTTVTSSFADVTGARSGTDFTIATNAYTSTTNQNVWMFRVNLGPPRKRYLAVVASPQTTMVMAAVAMLGRAEQAPDSAANADCLNVVTL